MGNNLHQTPLKSYLESLAAVIHTATSRILPPTARVEALG